MKYTAFHESQFRHRVDAALKQVKTILDVNRNPRYAEDQDHSYDDKYALTESLVNTAIAAQVNLFERMGLTEEKLRALRDIVMQDKRTVTLRFEAEDTCTFLKEQKVNVVTNEGSVVVETTKSSFVGARTTTESNKHKISRTVREYHWEVGVTYKIFCYAGNNPTNSPIELQSRTSSTVVVTTGNNNAPFPKHTVHTPLAFSLTWLLQKLKPKDKQFVCNFKIDRTKDSCRTPRRNDDVRGALEFFDACQQWSSLCARHFSARVEKTILRTHSPANPQPSPKSISLDQVVGKEVFCPVLPLMETPRALAGTATRHEQPQSLLVIDSSLIGTASTTTPLMSLGDLDVFMNEQCRSLDKAVESLSSSFDSHQLMRLITTAEAKLTLMLRCTMTLAYAVQEGVDYIEHMLRKQLIAAIGKLVKPEDFDQFMSFHLQKLFSPSYAPKPFCYAVRRPDRFPDGMLSIERANTDKLEPIETMVRMISPEDAPPISIPLNAATTVQMTGARYLHGWIQHRFGSATPNKFTLAARARQFSSFMLIVGTMGGAEKFVPKDAIVLQNKDEVLIPILVNELPTAKEFKDAISSLSPEQKRFAESFRSMQLESSVLGVCLVQLKPQLEVLLGLPSDSLTKEIRLTQDLMSLFIEYQVPSDLLSYDGNVEAGVKEKVERVKEHVKSVNEVIDGAKEQQLGDAANEAHMKYMSSAAPASLFQSNIAMAATAAAPFPILAKSAADSRTFGAPAPAPFGVQEFSQAPAMFGAASPGRYAAPPGVATASFERLSGGEFVERRASNRTPSTVSSSSLSGATNNTTQPTVGIVGEPTEQSGGVVDFTLIPKLLDAKFEKHDSDSSLRATILKTDKVWRRKRQENLLTKPKTTSLHAKDIRSEKDKAFDLLDALSRSGSLGIGCAELHVIVSVTHCFEKDVMGTVIQDNVNPIEKVEKSCLMIASTIQGTDGTNLLASGDEQSRLQAMFPELLEG